MARFALRAGALTHKAVSPIQRTRGQSPPSAPLPSLCLLICLCHEHGLPRPSPPAPAKDGRFDLFDRDACFLVLLLHFTPPGRAELWRGGVGPGVPLFMLGEVQGIFSLGCCVHVCSLFRDNGQIRFKETYGRRVWLLIGLKWRMLLWQKLGTGEMNC